MSAQSPRAYTLFVGSPITCRFLSVRICNIIFHFSLGGLDPAILPLLDYFYVYEGLYNSWTCTCPFLFLSTPRDLTNWVGDSPVLHTTNPQGRSSPLLSFTQSDVTSLKTVTVIAYLKGQLILKVQTEEFKGIQSKSLYIYMCIKENCLWKITCNRWLDKLKTLPLFYFIFCIFSQTFIEGG